MIFLIDYDRRAGRIVTFKKYGDSARQQATEARLQLELDLNRQGIEREVVLLDAPSEEILRMTHARYFSSVPELAKAAARVPSNDF